MRVKTLGPGTEFRVEVDELSGLAGWGQEVTMSGLLAVGDELTAVFAMSRNAREPDLRPDAWDTGHEAPRKSGSNFEGIAADASGTIVVVTEVPAGLVVVELSARDGHKFLSHTRVRFDETSMRKLAHIDGDDALQPEGVVLLRGAHVLVAHEKKPHGLFELGPPGDEPLGLHPGSYLPSGDGFTVPARLAALAWWPTPHALHDISDMAVWNNRLHFLSDKSSCIARLHSEDLEPGDELEFDAIWKLPDEPENAEGLIFTSDGSCYVGFDVALEDEPTRNNLLHFEGLP